MGADTPAEGGENKPKIKIEDDNVPSNAGRNNFRRNNNGNSFIDFYCGNELEELMFLQPHVTCNSRTGKLSTPSKTGISESWILLDSQSTIDLFSNSKLLSNIHEVDTTLRIRCNAGMKTTNYRGYLSGYGWVWYYPQGTSETLSLGLVPSSVTRYIEVTFL